MNDKARGVGFLAKKLSRITQAIITMDEYKKSIERDLTILLSPLKIGDIILWDTAMNTVMEGTIIDITLRGESSNLIQYVMGSPGRTLGFCYRVDKGNNQILVNTWDHPKLKK